MVLNDGSLAVIFNAAAGGVPTGTNAEQTITSTATSRLTCVVAPLAGTQPFPSPLVWGPPVYIADNLSNGVRAQRAGSLPSAAYDTRTGTLAVAWEDARLHTESTPVNDILVATSANGGVTWSSPVKANPSTPTDNVDRYNASISGGGDGILHLAYRSRQEGDSLAQFSPSAQTYYQESSDGGATWSAPLQVSTTPNNNLNYGAFSRHGTFEGDYNSIASAGGFSYVVRDEAHPAHAGEPVALTPSTDPSMPFQLELTGQGHQHQETWVAVVGPPTSAAPAIGSQVAGQSTAAPSPSAAVNPGPAASAIPNTTAASAASPARLALLVGGWILVSVVLARRQRRRRRTR